MRLNLDAAHLSDAPARELAVEIPDLDEGDAPLAFLVRERSGECVPLRVHDGGFLYPMPYPHGHDLASCLAQGWGPATDLYGNPAFMKGRPASGEDAGTALLAALDGVVLVDGSAWRRIPDPVLVLSEGVASASLAVAFGPREPRMFERHFALADHADALAALAAAGGAAPARPLVIPCGAEEPAPAPGP